MVKKISAALTAFVMVFGIGATFGVVQEDVFTISASAEDNPTSGECGENLTWKLDDKGTLTISGTGDMDLAQAQLHGIII